MIFMYTNSASYGLFGRLLSYATPNRIKRFGIGITVGAIFSSIMETISGLSQVIGLSHKVLKEIRIRELIVVIQKNNKEANNFNIERLLNAPCSLKEFTSQYNSHFFDAQQHITSFGIKAATASTILIVPILEEFIFRYIIQDFLLTQIPHFIIKKFAPGKNISMDSNTAKISKIFLSSAMFSAWHMLNHGIYPESFVRAQVVVSFVAGIGLGILKESEVDLSGTMGAHLVYDMIAMAPVLFSC